MSLEPVCKPTHLPDNFDIQALQEKYRAERDKRLRPEGERQYVEVADDFAGFYETDPYSPPVVRAPINAEMDVAILGGGFAGLVAAARLKEAGVADVRVIEMGGDFGGTWYWNRYPGVQCDIESYCYIPLLEELNYIPKDRYAYGPEIYEHCQRIGRHYGLYEAALFGTIVRSLHWDDAEKRWRIATNRGDELRARFLIMASGPYNRPKLPGISGIKTFKGHSFHTSRWDFDYTGGDTEGGLVKLADKRVAIIGTGATAIQVVPYLGEYAEHLYVLQRTPSAVDERGNRKTDPAWARSLKPGWQAARQRNFHTGTFERFGPDMADHVCDGWTEVNRNVQAKLAAMGQPDAPIELYLELRERESHMVMERLRRRIEQVVTKAAAAEMLKPWYQFLCKRPTFSDDYLPTFNRDNVTLLDVSESRGVERITETGIVANGVAYDVDCIIFASGFEITTEMRRRIGIETIAGRGGLSLYDAWADGFRTLHGQMTHGFPNAFFTGFIQGGASVNVSAMYEQQARNITYIIKETLDREAAAVEPSRQAQDGWVKTMRETEISNLAFLKDCTPGYYNNEGAAVIRSHLGEAYGPGFYAFDELLAKWRAQGELAGLDLTS